MSDAVKARERAAKRLREGSAPDPLGLGRPSIAEPGHRRPWEIGERRLMGNGYIYVKTEQGEKTEARLVMEKTLGRELAKGESARHRNGDTLDARPENLVLFRDNMPVEIDDAMNGKPKRTRRAPRANAYALIEIPERAKIVRARSAAEAEKSANGTPVVAVSLSRVRKKLRGT
jgi:hypothetical protein